jgi:hypothetical protein
LLDLSVYGSKLTMTPYVTDPVFQQYAYNIKSFAYSTVDFTTADLGFNNTKHKITTSPIYDREDYKYTMLLYGVSPSYLLDSSISAVY